MSATFEIPDWMITPASPPAAPDLSDVDPHRVEGLVNRFIAAKQDALYDAPDAFYRHEGADALLRVPFVRNRLIGLKGRLLDMPWSDFPPSSSKEEPIVQLLPYHPRPSWEQEPIAQLLPAYPGQLDQSALQDFRVPLTGGERAVLGERLDAHIADAMDGIDRHAAAQRDVLTRQTIGERQALIQRAAELDHNNDDKLTGLADAHASAAQELARMNGEPEGPATEAAAPPSGARPSASASPPATPRKPSPCSAASRIKSPLPTAVASSSPFSLPSLTLRPTAGSSARLGSQENRCPRAWLPISISRRPRRPAS